MIGRAGAVVRVAARLLAGPLAIWGFFLPWAHGPGLFSATAFSGYDLLNATGRLQQLDAQFIPDGLLWAARIGILGVAVAGVWHSLLAPAHRWHPCYALSGWYLVVSASVALLVGAMRSGLTVPQPGLLLWAVGAALFLLSGPHPGFATPLRRVWRRRSSKSICDGEGPTTEDRAVQSARPDGPHSPPDNARSARWL